MSTILKALRRLENEDPRKKNAGTPLVLRDPEAGSPAPAQPAAAPHPAPYPATDPRAADALRNRILAEEAAARLCGAAPADTTETSRRWRPLVLAAIAAALVIVAIPFAMTRTRFFDTADPASDTTSGMISGIASNPPSETTIDTRAVAAREITGAAESASAPGIPSRPSPEPAELPVRTMVAVDSPDAPTTTLAAAPAPSALPVLSAPAAPAEAAAASPPATATGPGAPSAERPPVPERAQTTASTPAPTPMPADRSSAPSPVSRPTEVAAASAAARRSDSASGSQETMRPISTPESSSFSPVSSAASASEPAAGPPVAARASEPVASRPASAPTRDVQRVTPTGMPEIHVVRTDWHPKPERRSARVRVSSTDELITAHEGETVAGLVVHEITPSAVVFSAGDVEIRRRVGDDPSRR